MVKFRQKKLVNTLIIERNGKTLFNRMILKQMPETNDETSKNSKKK